MISTLLSQPFYIIKNKVITKIKVEIFSMAFLQLFSVFQDESPRT